MTTRASTQKWVTTFWLRWELDSCCWPAGREFIRTLPSSAHLTVTFQFVWLWTSSGRAESKLIGREQPREEEIWCGIVSCLVHTFSDIVKDGRYRNQPPGGGQNCHFSHAKKGPNVTSLHFSCLTFTLKNFKQIVLYTCTIVILCI